jgi:hypothetical protein
MILQSRNSPDLRGTWWVTSAFAGWLLWARVRGGIESGGHGLALGLSRR